MDLCKHIGNRLRQMRERKGYLAWEVAKICCVTEYDIISVEEGNRLPSYELLENWCRTLGSSVSSIMSAYRWVYTETIRSSSM